MTEIFKAATVEEAKALAAKKFGKDIRSIKFEIIEEGKKGLFGIGKNNCFFPPLTGTFPLIERIMFVCIR